MSDVTSNPPGAGSRVRALLSVPKEGSCGPEGVPIHRESLAAEFAGWLLSHDPVFVLPPGVEALLFDSETGRLLGRLGGGNP